MKKKLLCIIMLMFIFSFVGCSNKDNQVEEEPTTIKSPVEEDSTNSESQEEEAPTTTESQEEEAPTTIKSSVQEAPTTIKSPVKEAPTTIKSPVENKSSETTGEKQILLSRDKNTYTNNTTYEELARNPEKYINSPVKFTGTVTQIIQVDGDYSTIRMNVDDDYNQNLMVIFETNLINFNLLENDNITIYAGSMGLESYESVFGKLLTVPKVCAVMLDLNDNAVVNDCLLQAPQTPLNVNYISWGGNINTTINIEKIEYGFEKNYNGTYLLTLYFTGSKTYENENEKFIHNVFSYKLYDSNNYVVKSGDIFLNDMLVGEKFKNKTEIIYNLPSENYRLEIFDYK